MVESIPIRGGSQHHLHHRSNISSSSSNNTAVAVAVAVAAAVAIPTGIVVQAIAVPTTSTDGASRPEQDGIIEAIPAVNAVVITHTTSIAAITDAPPGGDNIVISFYSIPSPVGPEGEDNTIESIWMRYLRLGLSARRRR